MIKNTNSLNEELKKRETSVAISNGNDGEVKLDDTQRVKVLSPGRLVVKRFLRNKLALTGLGILIFMFLFAFVGPLFYSYSQTQIFYTHKPLQIDYASASERKEYVAVVANAENKVPSNVKNLLNSNIAKMEKTAENRLDIVGNDGKPYRIEKVGEGIYTLSEFSSVSVAEWAENSNVATYSMLGGKIEYTGPALGEKFENAARENVKGKSGSFSVDGTKYAFSAGAKKQYSITCEGASFTYSGEALGKEFEQTAENSVKQGAFSFDGSEYIISDNGNGVRTIARMQEGKVAYVATIYGFDASETGRSFTDAFKSKALLAVPASGEFEVDGVVYRAIMNKNGVPVILGASGEVVAELSPYVVRRYSGKDTLSLEFKERVRETMIDMNAQGKIVDSFTFSLPEMNENGEYVLDENGDPQYVDTVLTIKKKNSGEFVINCEQVTYVIDIYAGPTKEHLFGTDGDGMDILARMMYGGRVSLMVGFVVVLMETVLGVLLGGLAGFFSGWIDTLIMRLVDIFYCIPTYPILIIMGAFFDALKMDPYRRLFWMMVILGVLGWAGVARLVRGQILSLREQEFMVAQEATGMRAGTRILRHLVPNVMPYLIVNATMGLGSVIITESTLSFLGLGVKHPLATWGTMINSVASSSESMIKYTYIWIPVGILICFTVIAFNFVGDGLRDAFDPKTK